MNAHTDRTHTCDTDALNTLLRGEMGAVETYTRALGHFADPFVIADLQKIRDEHSRAVRELRDRVIRFGGHPSERAGEWGSATAAVATAAKAVGPAAVLASLRQGEEATVGEYTAALENDDIAPECHRTIRADLLTACQRHAEELDRLLGGMDH